MTENTYQIRLIQPEDDAAIEQVIRTVLIEYQANHEGTAWAGPNLGCFSKVYAPEKNALWVAIDQEGKFLGGAGIGYLKEGLCELQKMYLLPKARNQGLGSALMQTALDYARKYYQQVYIETLPNMVEAQAMYEKFGFVKIEEPAASTDHFACDVRYLLSFEQEKQDEPTGG